MDKDTIANNQMDIADLMIDKDQIAVTTDIRQTVMTEITETVCQREKKNKRYPSKDRNNYDNRNKSINNIHTKTQNDDPPGIDEYEYTSESSNEDQAILDKFYNANEDTCNSIINTLESNPAWILPMYHCTKLEQNFTKQKPILEIDFLLDSGATLNLLNEDTWNES